MQAITTTDFHFPNQKRVYHGKVRDVYEVGDRLIVIATDRISAFDHILPRPIPFKGDILNSIAAYFLYNTKLVCPNWLELVPHPNVSMGKICEPIRIEMVIRGYLAGHAAREYKAGKRTLCGVPLPDGLKENDRLPEPIITPSTKALEGHDEDISRDEIIARGLVPKAIYEQMERYTRALFQRGTEMVKERGLLLVDTKYEFGLHNGELMLIDEVHTPDSSRYFYADGYEERQRNGEPQKQLSKEFVREWLMANGFQGKPGQQMPEMTDEVVMNISNRYAELFEIITGSRYDGTAEDHSLESIEQTIREFL